MHQAYTIGRFLEILVARVARYSRTPLRNRIITVYPKNVPLTPLKYFESSRLCRLEEGYRDIVYFAWTAKRATAIFFVNLPIVPLLSTK